VGSGSPVGVNFIAGSGTSWGGINPGFTVIEYDEEFMVPINIFTWVTDLDEAN